MNETEPVRPAPSSERWSPLAMASLVLSVVPVVSLAAAPLGIAALVQVRRRPGVRGHALAWAGIAVGAGFSALTAFLAWGTWKAGQELVMRPEVALRAAWGRDPEPFRAQMAEDGALATAAQVESWIAPLRERLGELRSVRLAERPPDAAPPASERTLVAAYEAEFAGPPADPTARRVPLEVTFERPAFTESIGSYRVRRFAFRLPDGTRIVFPGDERREPPAPADGKPGTP